LVAEALWNIDRRTNDTVQACLRILKSPNLQFNEGVARQALELLGRMGSAAREALPVLRDLFPKAPTPIRLQVELALRSIDAPTLDALYSDANRTARKQIERIVISLGTQDVWAPTPERTNFFRALLLIGALGPEAKSAQPRLVELLETLPAA